MKFKGIHMFVALVTVGVLSVIIAGFVTVGPPSLERARRLDQQRVNDLQQISSAVDQYYNQDGRDVLPSSLTDLRQTQNSYVPSLADPKTGQPYGYRVTSSTAYELCATFEMDASSTNPHEPGLPYPPMMPMSKGTLNGWSHGVGRTCFPITVQKWPKPM